jgi:hypothetical protein
MSINHFFNKIKGLGLSDKTTRIYLFIIVLVAVSAFGLGRLSGYSASLKNDPISITSEVLGDSTFVSPKAPLANPHTSSVGTIDTANTTFQKNYVASKNGKLYYPSGCRGAQRIAEKNQVWFATQDDAEQSGFKKASSCK